jgi:hypothetical protein
MHRAGGKRPGDGEMVGGFRWRRKTKRLTRPQIESEGEIVAGGGIVGNSRQSGDLHMGLRVRLGGLYWKIVRDQH